MLVQITYCCCECPGHIVDNKHVVLAHNADDGLKEIGASLPQDATADIDKEIGSVTDEEVKSPEPINVTGKDSTALKSEEVSQEAICTIHDKTDGVVVTSSIPQAVTTKPTKLRYDSLQNGAGGYPESASFFKIKWTSDSTLLAANIMAQLTSAGLVDPNFAFKSASIPEFESMMDFFVPAYTANTQLELGPGIYTTKSLETAARNAGNGGVVMVFQSVTYDIFKKEWWPKGQDWVSFVEKSLGYATHAKLPANYCDFDIIGGAVCDSCKKCGKKIPVPAPGGEEQMVWRSLRALQYLRARLFVVVYLTEDVEEESEGVDSVEEKMDQ